MIVYRITKERYAEDLTGNGARRFGGRWNNKGIPVVYTSEHRSLCLLEMLVHTPVDSIPADVVLVKIFVPDEFQISGITTGQLPQSWKTFPYDPFTKQIGDELLRPGNHPVIKVPSALVDEEFNYLINPAHERAAEVSIVEVRALDLDSRLFNS